MDAEKMKELSTDLSKLRKYLKERDMGYTIDVFNCVSGILDLLSDIRFEGGKEKDVATVEKQAGLPIGFSELAEKLIISLGQAGELLDGMRKLLETADKEQKNV